MPERAPACRCRAPRCRPRPTFTYSTNDAALGLTAKNPGLDAREHVHPEGLPDRFSPRAQPTRATIPFGIWFANPDTLYVADEGAGDNTNTTFTATANGTYSAAAASTTAGLQKWVFDSTTQQWNLAYTLQAGL